MVLDTEVLGLAPGVHLALGSSGRLVGILLNTLLLGQFHLGLEFLLQRTHT
jgi:hypothetical protein